MHTIKLNPKTVQALQNAQNNGNRMNAQQRTERIRAERAQTNLPYALFMAGCYAGVITLSVIGFTLL